MHVDVDLIAPTHDSLTFFYPRLSDGGILLSDDYGFRTCPGATRAFDEFFATRPEKPMPLPGGGAFVIKGRPVGPDLAEVFGQAAVAEAAAAQLTGG